MIDFQGSNLKKQFKGFVGGGCHSLKADFFSIRAVFSDDDEENSDHLPFSMMSVLLQLQALNSTFKIK